MVRDTARTTALVRHLKENGILATGLNYPVVPKGDEEIRFQVNADHTEDDIDGFAVLAASATERPEMQRPLPSRGRGRCETEAAEEAVRR